MWIGIKALLLENCNDHTSTSSPSCFFAFEFLLLDTYSYNFKPKFQNASSVCGFSPPTWMRRAFCKCHKSKVLAPSPQNGLSTRVLSQELSGKTLFHKRYKGAWIPPREFQHVVSDETWICPSFHTYCKSSYHRRFVQWENQDICPNQCRHLPFPHPWSDHKEKIFHQCLCCSFQLLALGRPVRLCTSLHSFPGCFHSLGQTVLFQCNCPLLDLEAHLFCPDLAEVSDTAQYWQIAAPLVSSQLPSFHFFIVVQGFVVLAPVLMTAHSSPFHLFTFCLVFEGDWGVQFRKVAFSPELQIHSPSFAVSLSPIQALEPIFCSLASS